MFHNIFEKPNKKARTSNKIKPKIIADIHEKNSLVLSELKSSSEISLEITSLKIGDYFVGNTIIERKTASDFISSLISKRLIQQLIQMQEYEKRLIILEGDLEQNLKKYSKINPNAIRGFILSIINNFKTPIIQTKDYKDTANYLILLSKQQIKNKSEISLHSRIPRTLNEQKKYILESFPSIGPIKAELLLEKFKSLSNIFNASEQELRELLKNQTKDFKEILEK